MKLVIVATGASGAIYLQRLLEQIDCAAHEVHLVVSAHAQQVAAQEIDRFQIPKGVSQHAENDLNVPFVSGSAHFDAMVIVPCSMATLGRIASGSSDSALLRAADVFLKEADFSAARNAVESYSRAQRRHADRSWRNRLAGDPVFLQSAKVTCRSCRYRCVADSRSSRLAQSARFSLAK